MSRTVTRAEMTRILKAAQESGLKVVGCILSDGKFEVIFDERLDLAPNDNETPRLTPWK